MEENSQYSQQTSLPPTTSWGDWQKPKKRSPPPADSEPPASQAKLCLPTDSRIKTELSELPIDIESTKAKTKSSKTKKRKAKHKKVRIDSVLAEQIPVGMSYALLRRAANQQLVEDTVKYRSRRKMKQMKVKEDSTEVSVVDKASDTETDDDDHTYVPDEDIAQSKNQETRKKEVHKGRKELNLEWNPSMGIRPLLATVLQMLDGAEEDGVSSNEWSEVIHQIMTEEIISDEQKERLTQFCDKVLNAEALAEDLLPIEGQEERNPYLPEWALSNDHFVAVVRLRSQVQSRYLHLRLREVHPTPTEQLERLRRFALERQRFFALKQQGLLLRSPLELQEDDSEDESEIEIPQPIEPCVEEVTSTRFLSDMLKYYRNWKPTVPGEFPVYDPAIHDDTEDFKQL